ncbi:MAG: SMI1/KNR4 family protein [Actinomycetia bacterium]|nr:SMI1/KNR4 family protein [Actinomycetes bacterium]
MDATGCEPSELDAAEQRLGLRLPNPLRTLLGIGDGRYDTAGQWWIVWPLEQLVEDNEKNWREGWVDRSLVAFGDDGAGDPFCMYLDGSSDTIVRWSMTEREVFEEYPTLSDFAVTWLAPEGA